MWCIRHLYCVSTIGKNPLSILLDDQMPVCEYGIIRSLSEMLTFYFTPCIVIDCVKDGRLRCYLFAISTYWQVLPRAFHWIKCAWFAKMLLSCMYCFLNLTWAWKRYWSDGIQNLFLYFHYNTISCFDCPLDAWRTCKYTILRHWQFYRQQQQVILENTQYYWHFPDFNEWLTQFCSNLLPYILSMDTFLFHFSPSHNNMKRYAP